MNVIIAKIGADSAIIELENREKVNMPIQLIPNGAEVGTVLTISINAHETNKGERGINKLIDDLWKK